VYKSNCASCHGEFEASTLRGRTISSEIIFTAINSKISAMASLRGRLSEKDVDAIEAIFNQPDPTGPLTSAFTCNTPEDEKKSSVELRRLNGSELRNTYAAMLPTT